MDDGFINWGFMPSTTGYILVKASSEYAAIETHLLKAGSFEEVYLEFIKEIEKTQKNWYSNSMIGEFDADMRESYMEEKNKMYKFFAEAPPSEVKRIMEPLEVPMGYKNAEKPLSVTFGGWDWDWSISFNLTIRGPYLNAAPHHRPGLPVCTYWAEDSTHEYYGTNIALLKLET